MTKDTEGEGDELELDLKGIARALDLLTKDTRYVELLPERLINDGCTMRLIPGRDNTPMRGEQTKWDSLPTLELAKAGIEVDRRTDTITKNVVQLLAGRRFRLKAKFNLPAALAILPELGVMIQMRAFAWALRESHPLMEPNRKSVEDALTDLVKDFQAEFVLELEGPEIPGLDISKPVSGFLGNIAQFVLPDGTFDKESAEGKALQKAVDFYATKFTFEQLKRQYKDYLETNQLKWWFGLFNRRRSWESSIAEWRAKVAQQYGECTEAFAALPA